MTRLVQLRLIPQILSAPHPPTQPPTHPSPNQAAWDNRTAKSFCPLHNRVRIPQGEILQSIISPDGTIFSKQRSCPENSDAIAQNNLLPTNDCSTNNLFHIPLLQNICSQRLLNFELCSDWSRTACNTHTHTHTTAVIKNQCPSRREPIVPSPQTRHDTVNCVAKNFNGKARSSHHMHC